MEPGSVTILLLLLPIIIGWIIASVNTDGVNNFTEKIEQWIRAKQVNVSRRNNWFYRYVLNPLLWVLVKFSDWTDSFAHRGLKNGVRVAATFYLIFLWCLILFTAIKIVIMIVIAVIVLYIIFRILAGSSDDGGSDSSAPPKPPREKDDVSIIGIRGKNVYSGTNWFNEELKGRVDQHGYIYKGTTWLNEERIGRIDSDGNIYKGTYFLNEEVTGRIDKDGDIYNGTNWFNEEKVGRIDSDGNIYKGSNWFSEEKTGRTGD